MAQHRLGAPAAPGEGQGSLDVIVMVLLFALAAVLVLVGVARPGSAWALEAGSAAGAVALVLVARRSMEAFTLLVLVARPALDGLHASGRTAFTDPATAIGAVFVVVSVVWLAMRWLQGRRHPKPLAGLALAGFLVAATIATLGGDAPVHSTAELARLATAVLMFFVVDRLCEDTGRPDRIVMAILGAAVVPVAVALVGPTVGLHRTEVKDQLERAMSTFAQSNPFGHFLTIVVLILAAYLLVRRGRPRLLAAAALVPVGLTLGLTYTRLAWGAVVIGFLVMAWACGRRWLVPAALVLLLALAVVTPEVGHRLEQLTSSNAAVPGSESGISWRLGQWADVASLAGGNPITGIGPDVVPMRLANHQPPHNDYLRAFVEMGIVGLLAYLGMLAALAGVAISAQRRAQGPEARTIALAFVGVISAFAVASGAANLLGQVVLLWYVLALAAAAAWVARHRRLTATSRPPLLSERVPA